MPVNPNRPFEVYAFHFKDESYDNNEHTIISYINAEGNKHRIHLAVPNVLHIAIGEGEECDHRGCNVPIRSKGAEVGAKSGCGGVSNSRCR